MKTYCLLNHTLAENQIDELKNRFESDEILYPSEELSKKWAQIPAENKINRDLIEEIVQWLGNANPGDTLIIQGEFGSTFMLVDWAEKNGLIPLHAVSERISLEKKEGNNTIKQSVFKHVCFREYERY